jgi:hypothetical protein
MRAGRAVVVMAAMSWPSPAGAQSVYVAGAIGAEIVRTSSTRSGGSTYDAGSGEAFAGAIRIGTSISERFGVELEFYRPGEIETDTGGPLYLPAAIGDLFPGGPVASGLPPDLSFPSILSESSRVRAATTSALAFARQSLGTRVELVYLGGVGFSRVVREIEYGFGARIPPLELSILPASYSSRSTQYAAGPVVGVEVRAGMTDHAQLVAGLRMHMVGQGVLDGWMIRPNAGLAWKF